MKDYSLIENTWQGDLVKHYFADSTLSQIKISDEDKHILEHIGLPLMRSIGGLEFLPFTFYQELTIGDKDFYLLGDTGIKLAGIKFVGLEIEVGSIYHLVRDKGQKLHYRFLNQGLYQYLMCLAYYINFIKTEYPHPSNEVNKQVQSDYQKLINNMTKVDAKAMEYPNCFWFDQVDRLKVSGYGDYLTDREIPTDENLRTYTQEEIDNMDLPF